MTQLQFKRNLRLINWLAGLNNASFFVPFAVPFWLGEDLTQQKIYLLQSIFTLVMMVLEVPTGVLADRIGRRTSLIIAACAASVGFAFYSMAHGFWQFAAAETLLALGLSLNSGTIEAMRHESALALDGDHGRSSAGTAHSARLLSAALCSVIGGVVVKIFGFRTAMVLDALTYVGAALVVLKMAEPPHQLRTRGQFKKARPLLWSMAGLILLFALLREATHIPVFLNARVLEGAGISIGWYGVIFASLQLIGSRVARVGHRWESSMGERRTIWLLVSLATASYLATGMLPARMAPLGLIGFGVLFGLTRPFMDHALNSRVHDNSMRATVNSCATLVSRSLYFIAGPLVGTLVDTRGVQSSLVIVGVAFALLVILPLRSSLRFIERR